MKFVQLACLIASASAIKMNNSWEYTPYLTADYVKKNNADVDKTTQGYLNRENETKESAIQAGYETTRYNSTYSIGEALSPTRYRRVAVQEADEREAREDKASKEASDKAKADEMAADKEKEGKGETAVKRPMPASAKAPVEFVMPKFIEDREPVNQQPEKPKRIPSWRAPDEALKTMNQTRSTKDETWIDSLPEKMYKQQKV